MIELTIPLHHFSHRRRASTPGSRDTEGSAHCQRHHSIVSPSVHKSLDLDPKKYLPNKFGKLQGRLSPLAECTRLIRLSDG